MVPLGIVAGRVPCPKCQGKKTCAECLGVGMVTLEKAGELFGLEPNTRRDTPRALEIARADESRDTDPAPPPSPRWDPRREPDE